VITWKAEWFVHSFCFSKQFKRGFMQDFLPYDPNTKPVLMRRNGGLIAAYSPPSMAIRSGMLDVGLIGEGSHLAVLSFSPEGKWLHQCSTGDGYKGPQIAAARNGGLYCGFVGTNTHLNLSQVAIAGGFPSEPIVKLSTSGLGTDGTPFMCATPNDSFNMLAMAWQGKRNPPFLEVAAFSPPSDGGDFLVGRRDFNFSVQSAPSIVFVEDKMFVAFATDSMAPGYHLCIVTLNASLQEVASPFVDPTFADLKSASIVQFGDYLYVGFVDSGKHLNIGRVQPSWKVGPPSGFEIIGTSGYQTDVWPTLFTVPGSMLMGWQYNIDMSPLAIGKVTLSTTDTKIHNSEWPWAAV
jgi:hypothetical protein